MKPLIRPMTPTHALQRRRFGLVPVRSPLLGESLLLSFPPGTEMFQFPGFASALRTDAGIAPGGLPHSDIRASTGICPYTRLFAAYHVLLRLREPRHPPCALAHTFYLLFLYLGSYVCLINQTLALLNLLYLLSLIQIPLWYSYASSMSSCSWVP